MESLKGAARDRAKAEAIEIVDLNGGFTKVRKK